MPMSLLAFLLPYIREPIAALLWKSNVAFQLQTIKLVTVVREYSPEMVPAVLAAEFLPRTCNSAVAGLLERCWYYPVADSQQCKKPQLIKSVPHSNLAMQKCLYHRG